MSVQKILVADDSATIQKVIRLTLTNENYELETVSDGARALELLTLFRPDLVLVDVSLPKKSAFELKAEANAMSDLKSIAFILLTSAFEKVDEKQLQTLGFSATLTKPFDPAHLRGMIAKILKLPAKPPGAEKPSSPPPAPPPRGSLPPLVPPKKVVPEIPLALTRPEIEGPFPTEMPEDGTMMWDPSARPEVSEELVSTPEIPVPPSEPVIETGNPESPPALSPPDPLAESFEWEAMAPEPVKDPGVSGVELASVLPPEASVSDLAPPPIPREISLNFADDADFDFSPDKAAEVALTEQPPDIGEIFPEFPTPTTAQPLAPTPLLQTATPWPNTDSSTGSPSAPSRSALPEWTQADLEKWALPLVESTLRKMTEQLLPELTERIIREELQRLLAD